jgi:tRNA-uridine 2-sulfurtransferase
LKNKVVIAISGGVDSSVAAFLLKEQGHEVIGITMCLGVTAEEGGKTKCCGPREIEDARRVCRILGIHHYVMDFSRDLEERIVKPFIEEYSRGRTPNPCVECNRHIKFGTLLDKASAMGFDFVATGHYAGMERMKGTSFLKRARDRKKDQTYFLYAVKRGVLDRLVFPLAGLTKDAVREIARKNGLPVSDKAESQDICFIPKEGYGAFFRARSIGVKPGELVDKKGNVLGKHEGIAFYTIGQRARLGGRPGEPLFVLSLDPRKDLVIVGEKKDLQAAGLMADRVNILVDDLPSKATAKIRYAHSGANCQVSLENGRLRILFDEPQEAVTPGQSVVLYDGEIVLGGGIISKAIHAN